MIKAVINAKKYFQAPEDYFWRWAENGEVIEWCNGSTICYRDDLLFILKELSVKGLPSLGSLLIILLACKEEVNTEHRFFFIRALQQFNDNDLQGQFDDAEKFVQIINSLPVELKTGKKRIHLIHEVFGETGFVFSNVQLRDAIDELSSGGLDNLIIEKGEKATKEQFEADLKPLSNALKKFPTFDRLVIKLKTGLKETPSPAEISIPDALPIGLFDQLSQDPITAGIARLARRLIAALNIPMHSQGSGDQSYGGITDITNRGNYDRLLLSELAQDSDLLMARLVNNEALYFRREEPPENPKRQRTILIDTTLKMWGIPRVFAISAALALANSTKHGELIEAYALGGESYNEINLDKKEGIIGALEILDLSLHCGKTLVNIVNDMSATVNNEYYFITDVNIFSSPAFHVSLAQMKESLGFILTVSRDGQIVFYECINGKTKLLSTAKLDLEELLFATGIITPRKIKSQPGINVAFLSTNPHPLLFPKSRIKKTENKLFYDDSLGLVAVNQAQRVLYIPKWETGCYELLTFIEKGTYNFGWNNSTELYIAVSNFQRKFFKIYTLNIEKNDSVYVDLSDQVQYATDIVFNNNKFYIRTSYAAFLFDCVAGEVIEKKEYNGYPSIFHPLKSYNLNKTDLARTNNFLSISYSIMYKVKEMYIGSNGKIVIGNYHLTLGGNSNYIRINENVHKDQGSHYSTVVATDTHLLKNKNIKFTIRKWEDGSEAIIDSRGFLHLKSSDSAIPEITIVLVTGTLSACWASDGTLCGSDYFLNSRFQSSIHTATFYQKYIQPFIDRILLY